MKNIKNINVFIFPPYSEVTFSFCDYVHYEISFRFTVYKNTFSIAIE